MAASFTSPVVSAGGQNDGARVALRVVVEALTERAAKNIVVTIPLPASHVTFAETSPPPKTTCAFEPAVPALATPPRLVWRLRNLQSKRSVTLTGKIRLAACEDARPTELLNGSTISVTFDLPKRAPHFSTQVQVSALTVEGAGSPPTKWLKYSLLGGQVQHEIMAAAGQEEDATSKLERPGVAFSANY